MIRVLSLGGGVQSVTVARKSLAGELPKLDHVIFADTGAEWPHTYELVTEMEHEFKAAGIGFHRVTCHYEQSSGSLYDDLMSEGKAARWASPPLFVSDDRGKGMTMRQCTGDYKKDPIGKLFRELAGVKHRSRGPAEVVAELWLGISAEESSRMKVSDRRWYRIWHPLIEGPRRMWRSDCIRWHLDRGLRPPRKSACFFCPFQSDKRWLEVADDPEMAEKAIRLDEHTRSAAQFKGTVYYHRSCEPLADVFERLRRERDQSPSMDLDMFEDECSGVCGVWAMQGDLT